MEKYKSILKRRSIMFFVLFCILTVGSLVLSMCKLPLSVPFFAPSFFTFLYVTLRFRDWRWGPILGTHDTLYYFLSMRNRADEFQDRCLMHAIVGSLIAYTLFLLGTVLFIVCIVV